MKLSVNLLERYIGVISNDSGSLEFAYDEDYRGDAAATALSFNLPLSEGSFGNRESLAFFANLLPEGEVRERTAAQLGVSLTNSFAMLAQLGRDCAGAAVLLPEGENEDEYEPPKKFSEAALAQRLAELKDRPIGDGEARMSLAGAQTKLAVIRDDRGTLLPQSWRDPTTHILKPEPPQYEGLVDNEWFCLSLASQCGLAAAAADAQRTVDGLAYLSVQRFDRDPLHAARLHQEDFCQALGLMPDEKYQKEGGPSAVQAYELIGRASAIPARDHLTYWRALIFNFLIGNCDAHAKNFSFLYESSRPTLAPLYDLVSTAVYPGLTKDLAAGIGEARRLDDVRATDFAETAERCGMNVKSSMRYVAEMAATVPARSRQLAELTALASPVIEEVLSGISRRADALFP